MSSNQLDDRTKTYAEILAEFVLGLEYDAIPKDVIQQAQLSTLDFLGVVLAGSQTPAAQMVAEYVKEAGGKPESTLFGSTNRVPLASAALANGTAGHSVELDDHEAHMRSKVHSAVTVMPVAWAVSEVVPVTGAEFLSAVVLGYDVIGRLSAATAYPDFLGRERGFHTTPLFGPFSAGATAGRLLGLSREQLVNMFGILGSLVSGLQETVSAGAMVKCFHAGWAVHSGLIAAKLAAKGFTGPPTIFEGKFGFYQAYCGAGNFDLSIIDANLGEEFDMSLTMYKPYACAGGIHPALTAVDQLRVEHHIQPDDVEEVLILTNPQTVKSFARPEEKVARPHSGPQGQFSLPYAVAVLLEDGSALMAQFTNEAVQNPKVLGLAGRVRVEVGEDLVAQDPEDEPATASIRLKDGRVVHKTVRGGKGSLAVPMDEAELVAKFQELAGPVIGLEQTQRVEERVLSLPTDASVGDLPSSLYRR
jgi:2-methylcitrate dehydratase PrpD